jgi:hypothetical protein
MRMTILRIGAWIAALLVFGVSAQARVVVSFHHPEAYADAGLQRDSAVKPTLGAIERHLQFLGDRYLPADHVLKVEILDIDLAGRFEPGRPAAADVRIMTEANWPRIQLRYSVEDDGRVVARGEDTIRDLNYLDHRQGAVAYSELRYEKAMLDEWFLTRLSRIVLPDGSSLVSFPPDN